MSFTLGIDGGASAAKWALLSDDGKFIEGTSNAIDGHVYREDSQARLEKVLQEIATKAGTGEVRAVYAGITGIGNRPESAEAVKSIFTKYFPKAKIEIVIDMVLGYRSHFDIGEGIFLYAGTGSIAIHINQSGEIIRAGGWGYLLGDEGAGYWMGREAIRRVVSALDMKLTLEKFESEILRKIGANDWDGIKSFVYSNDRSAIASLARLVIDLANSGDETATDIVLTAAEYLVDLVHQIELITGKRNLHVVFGGGISEAGELLIDAVNRGIGRKVTISELRMANRAAELAR